MAAKLGKCINYASCGIAYRNELIPAQTTSFVCPECGKPLKDRSGSMRLPPWLGALGVAAALLALAGGWWLFGRNAAPAASKKRANATSARMAEVSPAAITPTPTETVALTTPGSAPTLDATPPPASSPASAVFDPSAEPIVANVPDSRAPRAAGGKPTPAKAMTFAERIQAAAKSAGLPPPAPSVAPPAPAAAVAADTPPLPTAAPAPAASGSQTDIAQEREDVRREVLKRIDAIPRLTPVNRDKLYSSVEKAKSMNKMFSVAFDSGKASLRPSEEAEIKRQVKSAAFQQAAGDPSTVFVILGYADTQGDPQRNKQLSDNRAQMTLEMLRDRFSLLNAMNAVGMGGSNLLDASKKEKNRVAEIWAVSP